MNPSGPPPVGQAPGTTLQQPVVSLRPTDFTLPKSLDALFPEIELIRKLQDAEKRIDVFATRKWLELQESMQVVDKESSILRIFIYNIAENQLWQQELAKSQGKEVDETVPATWTLRIEGRLLGEDKEADASTRKKFSNYVTGIAIDLDSNAKFEPIDNNSPSRNIIEWHEMPRGNTAAFDGLDVKRKGSEKVKCKIIIQPKEYPAKFQLAEGLAEILGASEMSEKDVVYSLWQYVQINRLQDQTDKRLVNCNEELESVIGYKQIVFPELVLLTKKFLKPVEPIRIDYEVCTDKSSTLGDLVLDVNVDTRKVVSEDTVKDKELFFENDAAVKDLEAKMAIDIQALNQSRTKYEFFKKFSQDPIGFLDKWTESQAKSLKILTGDEGYTEENARRSEFYNDELLDDNIDLLFNSSRM